ncbi:ribosome hibernation-promoting factor, HPF/YfiA family [Allonocardiopsis opalescens]|uniref:Ribosome hibernation promoting factor n=1 Tax=Allonocardiopsis opalescens TaxID=1144618 RepID=A0A2T0QCC1_9ACTN|nr:ribosome-associated translation inhibitor RaiA [Allonocardiopsis opalescens]PRY01520.1 SSU ribosomal protein S30P /sigma 54 modulation protein [Allonocardiopsis opalescens]
MDIIVKGRRTGVSDRFRQHVETKLAKVGKLDQKVISVDVEVSQERNPRLADQRERVELTIRSRGPVIRAEASADDRYGALDLALGKLEARLRKISDRRKIHKGAAMPSTAALMTDTDPGNGVAAGLMAEPAPVAVIDEPVPDTFERPRSDTEQDDLVQIDMDGDGPLVVREKFHSAMPITIDQALHEMELVGHDFYLFRDKESGIPSVVYRRKGYNYGVLRLIDE